MIKFEHSIFINRSQQDVFDYITDPANNSQWQTGTESASWTSDGPHGVGSTYKVVTKYLGRKIEAELEYTGWDPPNQLSVKAVSGPVPFENVVTFEAQGDGTLVTQTGQAEAAGFFKMAEGLVGKQMQKSFETNIAALKLLLESQ
jgi:carbon monoxide dehydrogenase subunit G